MTGDRFADADYFRDMYAGSDDPWGFDTHHYERRKRELTVAMLPESRYGDVLELGSSTGALSELLVDRADRLLCVEIESRAVELARHRLAAAGDRVTVQVGDLATWRPDRQFDLVVASEVLYYLTEADLRDTWSWLRGQRAGGATIIAVDWRHPVAEHRWSGDEIHRQLATQVAAPAATYRDDDVIIEVVYPAGTPSIAARDGLVDGS